MFSIIFLKSQPSTLIYSIEPNTARWLMFLGFLIFPCELLICLTHFILLKWYLGITALFSFPLLVKGGGGGGVFAKPQSSRWDSGT